MVMRIFKRACEIISNEGGFLTLPFSILLASIIGSTAGIGSGIAGGVANKRARDEARGLAKQARRDQMSRDRESLALAHRKLDQEDKRIAIEAKKSNMSLYEAMDAKRYGRTMDYANHIQSLINQDPALRNSYINTFQRQEQPLAPRF